MPTRPTRPTRPDPAPIPAPANPAVRTLFAVASRAETGLFLIDSAGSVARLELERGWVHAMANVGERRPAGEETLRRLLDRLPAEAGSEFQERPLGGPLLGFHVTPFHPARVVRAYLEARSEAGAQARGAGPGAGRFGAARLRLALAPHASCLESDEQRVVALLARPRLFDDLLALAPRPRLERLVAFLEAAGALVVDDPTLAAAYTLLGLEDGAPSEEVKRAYRRLARDLHPDHHPGASADERRALEARFHTLTEAYRRILPGG